MLALYFAPGSGSFAVHIALHEIGVAYASASRFYASALENWIIRFRG
jgi:hypothetical protein